MKNLKKAMLGPALCLLCGVYGAAQTAPGTAAPGTVVYKTVHYEIYAMPASAGTSASAAAAPVVIAEGMLKLLAKELELRFEYYNHLFRYNPQDIPLLTVKAFGDDASYNAYIQAKLGASRPGAVYLHYSQAERRELCISLGSADTAKSLPQQTFLQYLRAFIPNPPPWIREGFAIYFNTLKFDPKGLDSANTPGVLVYEENLAWLPRAKSLLKNGPSLQSVLAAGTIPREEGNDAGDFQTVSWGLASFFLNSTNTDYQRTLSECFMVLSPEASSVENAGAVLQRISRWTDPAGLEKDYQAYLDSRRTFSELMSDGREAYDAKDLDKAESCFREAQRLRPANYAPPYYLGLIAFAKQDYPGAADYYKQSLANGGDQAQVLYALGINAVSAGNNTEAADYLKKAAAASPERFKAKAEGILANLNAK